MSIFKQQTRLFVENQFRNKKKYNFLCSQWKILSIRESVDKLPEKRKMVFTKSKIDGKKKEVAEELGISVKAIEKPISNIQYSL